MSRAIQFFELRLPRRRATPSIWICQMVWGRHARNKSPSVARSLPKSKRSTNRSCASASGLNVLAPLSRSLEISIRLRSRISSCASPKRVSIHSNTHTQVGPRVVEQRLNQKATQMNQRALAYASYCALVFFGQLHVVALNPRCDRSVWNHSALITTEPALLGCSPSGPRYLGCVRTRV